MHASLAHQLKQKGFSLYVSPPNSTPFTQACDKTKVNKNFSAAVVQAYTAWVNDQIPDSADEAPQPRNVIIPTPSKQQLAGWVKAAWEGIPDQDLIDAMRLAYFPGGMDFGQLPDSSSSSSTTAFAPTVVHLPSAPASKCTPSEIECFQPHTLAFRCVF